MNDYEIYSITENDKGETVRKRLLSKADSLQQAIEIATQMLDTGFAHDLDIYSRSGTELLACVWDKPQIVTRYIVRIQYLTNNNKLADLSVSDDAEPFNEACATLSQYLFDFDNIIGGLAYYLRRQGCRPTGGWLVEQ